MFIIQNLAKAIFLAFAKNLTRRDYKPYFAKFNKVHSKFDKFLTVNTALSIFIYFSYIVIQKSVRSENILKILAKK